MSGPEACHKECVQGTFWNKCGAGPTPGKTYLIFVDQTFGFYFGNCIFGVSAIRSCVLTYWLQ